MKWLSHGMVIVVWCGVGIGGGDSGIGSRVLFGRYLVGHDAMPGVPLILGRRRKCHVSYSSILRGGANRYQGSSDGPNSQYSSISRIRSVLKRAAAAEEPTCCLFVGLVVSSEGNALGWSGRVVHLV